MVRVGFSTPSWFNPISAIVRWATASRVSHAFLLYWCAFSEMWVVAEAHELGFRRTPWKRFQRYNKIIGLFAPKRSIDAGARKVLQEYDGTHYDLGMIGMAIVRLGKWLKRKWSNPFRDPKHVFCSESVVLAMRWSGGYEDFVDPAEEIDPETLLNYFAADGSKLLEDSTGLSWTGEAPMEPMPAPPAPVASPGLTT